MKQELTDQELNTYARQIVLADIGYDGQLKLRNAKVCLIGLGGLGSQIAPRMVGMGVGQLRMVDRDIVSRSDLHRQYLYDVDSLGRPKVEVAYEKLSRLNPDVELVVCPESLNSTNADEIIGGVDVVLDGLDSPEARYVVNRTCNRLKIPYVFAAAIEAYGNVSTLVPGKSMCLECFMPGLKDEDLPKCGVVGVHPAILGIVTGVQTSEAVRILMGQSPKLIDKILYIDLREMAFDVVELTADENCSVCGAKSTEMIETVSGRFFEETCARDGQRNFIISPRKRIEINLQKLGSVLAKKGFKIKTSGRFGITFETSKEMTICILKSATMIAQASPKLEDIQKPDILGIYTSLLVEELGLPSAILPET
ncbi:MAG: HesA/MoeB/ThiF family protein [Deltaproteobacteria bacterium]|nr:HesA/MoeB/ThiF family protein [Deltaproteobacteria bacterium]MBW1961949.1 HesA/MoeB/ThiF family protein [Deltaproteobacteria bacterium]MBW2151186.1 HesA/MoeB/ThiF family protein [Deltaproteobacteria bacterium]